MNDQKSLTDSQLLSILMLSNNATAVYSSYNLNIALANDAMLTLWGKTRAIIGMSLPDAIPELKSQKFITLLQQVWITGESYQIEDDVAKITVNGEINNRYFDYIYKPILDENGNTYAILHTAKEVTDRHSAEQLAAEKESTNQAFREELEAINEEYQAINEELTTLNEEYVATNEELNQANEQLNILDKELKKANQHLEIENLKLSSSERKALAMFADAPLALGVLIGEQMVIESANPMLLDIWGKRPIVIGEPLKQALPELQGQEFLALLDTVYLTGVAYYGTNALVYLERDGNLVEGYYNFVYHPLKNDAGDTESIMVVAYDVTDQVVADKLIQTLNQSLETANEELRTTNEEIYFSNEIANIANKKLIVANNNLLISNGKTEQAELFIRLAIEAANFGTWNIDRESRALNASPRLKELFGFHPEENVTVNLCIAQITDDYRDYVEKEIERAITKGGDYDLSYTVKGYHDQKFRWLRAIGNLSVDGLGEFTSFTGVTMDITDQKRDEQRKNDFISMVSHELKTPLTSLMAYIQMLQLTSKQTADVRTIGLLQKSAAQIKKMKVMITGFLDVARFGTGKLYLQTSIFQLDELIAEIVEDIRLVTNTHPLIFSVQQPLSVKADRDKIGQVVHNLISNAVKYSPHGKPIEVTYLATNNAVTFSVRDYGMGIPEADHQKLFDRFYRVTNSRTQNIAGFGIGLYLSSEIVKRHNGNIWVESKENIGSVFQFTIPTAM